MTEIGELVSQTERLTASLKRVIRMYKIMIILLLFMVLFNAFTAYQARQQRKMYQQAVNDIYVTIDKFWSAVKKAGIKR